MQRIKIDFKKLIGNHYDLDVKMFVLDWMLKTGRSFTHAYGWTVDGVNKSLYGYSANNFDGIIPLPIHNKDLFFDAVFMEQFLWSLINR